METMTVAERMTAQEFLALPERRWAQLIEGGVVVSQPSPRHQRATARVWRALDAWCAAASGRGEAMWPLDVGLDTGNIYAPDVLWYRSGRQPADGDAPPFPLPDLAVEVRSPSTWRFDIGVKKSTYERQGLPELWLVDTAADEVLIFRRSEPPTPSFDVSEELARGDTLTSPLLPGFALTLDALFG
jgi:Uma2 family endonuclease